MDNFNNIDYIGPMQKMQGRIDVLRRSEHKLWTWRGISGIAVLACLALVIGFSLRGKDLDHEVIVPQGGLYSLTLQDGTEVWLNSDSRFTYPDSFDGKSRRVNLVGEAYFKVSRDEKKPFFVESDGQTVKVLGTEFNVRAYPDEAETVTTLISGSVSINSSFVLAPGEQLVLDKSKGEGTVSKVSTSLSQGWKEGRLVLGNEPLSTVMKTVCHWYGVECTFLDEAAASTVLFGEISRYDSLDDVLEIISKVGGLNVSRDDNMITIASELQ